MATAKRIARKEGQIWQLNKPGYPFYDCTLFKIVGLESGWGYYERGTVTLEYLEGPSKGTTRGIGRRELTTAGGKWSLVTENGSKLTKRPWVISCNGCGGRYVVEAKLPPKNLKTCTYCKKFDKVR